MKKAAASKDAKTSNAAPIVRELPPNHESDVRGGITVSKTQDMATTG